MKIKKVDLNTVIWVYESGYKKGLLEKLHAHQGGGFLHKAVSVFIFNTKWELLLQKRGIREYHSGGLWTNTACTHVYSGEGDKSAAERALEKEMGMKGIPLFEVFQFTYKADVGNNLTEYEFDKIFVGFSDEKPNPNLSKVDDFQFKLVPDVARDIKMNPTHYTEWFKIILKDHWIDLFAGIREVKLNIS